MQTHLLDSVPGALRHMGALLRPQPTGRSWLTRRVRVANYCPHCAGPMSFLPPLPVASGQGVVPAEGAWRCSVCNV